MEKNHLPPTLVLCPAISEAKLCFFFRSHWLEKEPQYKKINPLYAQVKPGGVPLEWLVAV